jgi:hypothetical protein
MRSSRAPLRLAVPLASLTALLSGPLLAAPLDGVDHLRFFLGAGLFALVDPLLLFWLWGRRWHLGRPAGFVLIAAGVAQLAATAWLYQTFERPSPEFRLAFGACAVLAVVLAAFGVRSIFFPLRPGEPPPRWDAPEP